MGGKNPRGHKPWTPTKEHVRVVIRDVQAILARYVPTYGPMTLRQIFYRLVATTAYPKTDAAAKELSRTLAQARRAKLIDWADMRDDRGVVEPARGYDSVQEFLANVAWSVKNYALRGSLAQPLHYLLLCEAAGMVPMVARMVAPYGIEVRSKQGFDGAGAKHELAVEIMDRYEREGRPTRLMHLGDYDKAGRDIFGALKEDLEAYFAEEGLETCCGIERVALTPALIARFNVELDEHGNAQLEAIDPPDLERILIEAIERLWNHDIHARVLEQQERDRSRLAAWLEAKP
jgi:hypothetical protein